MRQTLRCISLKNENIDWDLSEGADAAWSSLTVFNVVGAPPNVSVGQIEFSYTFEFTPAADKYPFCNV